MCPFCFSDREAYTSIWISKKAVGNYFRCNFCGATMTFKPESAALHVLRAYSNMLSDPTTAAMFQQTLMTYVGTAQTPPPPDPKLALRKPT